MKLTQLIRSAINKKTTPKQKGKGRRGYGIVKRIRLLVYSIEKKIYRDKQLVRHLKNNPNEIKELGFESIPHRTTIGRWRKK